MAHPNPTFCDSHHMSEIPPRVRRSPSRIENGINAVRMLIPRCWFDAAKCARGLDALKLCRADYDATLQALRPLRCTTGPRTRRTRSAISP